MGIREGASANVHRTSGTLDDGRKRRLDILVAIHIEYEELLPARLSGRQDIGPLRFGITMIRVHQHTNRSRLGRDLA
jgi:hypothetical protein